MKTRHGCLTKKYRKTKCTNLITVIIIKSILNPKEHSSQTVSSAHLRIQIQKRGEGRQDLHGAKRQRLRGDSGRMCVWKLMPLSVGSDLEFLHSTFVTNFRKKRQNKQWAKPDEKKKATMIIITMKREPQSNHMAMTHVHALPAEWENSDASS